LANTTWIAATSAEACAGGLDPAAEQSRCSTSKTGQQATGGWVGAAEDMLPRAAGDGRTAGRRWPRRAVPGGAATGGRRDEQSRGGAPNLDGGAEEVRWRATTRGHDAGDNEEPRLAARMRPRRAAGMRPRLAAGMETTRRTGTATPSRDGR